ncbi:hypothetical protein FRX31_021066 [Thalictrum thalictroides]|uniref:Uncharacterized protein n=1 Tax=Thalictrum thalictroides TaxID=46969 RepID=A0A7J6VZ18_THATH|nr:hypothetical protein FRX31_021066 [Thalictrum thalictroides]
MNAVINEVDDRVRAYNMDARAFVSYLMEPSDCVETDCNIPVNVVKLSEVRSQQLTIKTCQLMVPMSKKAQNVHARLLLLLLKGPLKIPRKDAESALNATIKEPTFHSQTCCSIQGADVQS